MTDFSCFIIPDQFLPFGWLNIVFVRHGDSSLHLIFGLFHFQFSLTILTQSCPSTQMVEGQLSKMYIRIIIS